MGKAAKRRKTARLTYLAELSRKDPARFEMAYEIRVQSWLHEIKKLARAWEAGSTRDNEKRIFSILDEAMEILALCKGVSPAFINEAYGLLSHECCVQVATIIDPRIYRLSNMHRLPFLAKSTDRV